MASTQSETNANADTVPRTANLLACKQWWKVCFLYGDQEKYYRQIYGQAASQRLAQSKIGDEKGNRSRIIFPTKLHSPVVISGDSSDTFRLKEFTKTKKQRSFHDHELNPPKSSINVLDDPFLFGISEDHGSDSGIDANCTNSRKPVPTPPIQKEDWPRNPSNESASSKSGGYYNYANNINEDINEYNVVAPPPRPPKSSITTQQQQPDNMDKLSKE